MRRDGSRGRMCLPACASPDADAAVHSRVPAVGRSANFHPPLSRESINLSSPSGSRIRGIEEEKGDEITRGIQIGSESDQTQLYLRETCGIYRRFVVRFFHLRSRSDYRLSCSTCSRDLAINAFNRAINIAGLARRGVF